MQIAICDDEKSVGQILKQEVKKRLPDADIKLYLSAEVLIASGCKPDLLFLDIQMPGMDGMQAAKILRQNNEDMVLVFVTAAEEYVFQAFDVGAFHYLVKLFSDEKFDEVLKRAVQMIGKHSEKESDERYMMVQSAGSHIKVFFRDIVYAEVYNRKVIIHTRNTDIEYYGKMLDDHIENFCYHIFCAHGNLFRQICLSLYEKEKGSRGSQRGLYCGHTYALYYSAADG